jgi:hypothetical protein
MQLQRTTLRIKTDLKKAAEKKALEENISLQEIFNLALEDFLKKNAKKEAKKIIFKAQHLGEPLDNLTRDDFYPDPEN